MVEKAPWPLLNKSEMLEDRLRKNCERELACDGCAGTSSGSMNNISSGQALRKPDATLTPSMSRGATELAGTLLVIVGIWGLLVPGSC